MDRSSRRVHAHAFSAVRLRHRELFYKQTAGLDEVASQHTHVIGPQSNVVAIEEHASKKSKGNTVK